MKKQHLLKTLLLLCALVVGSMNGWATTYKLTNTTSVSAGNKYVFVRNSHALSNTVSSSKLQTTDSYSTTNLTGSEAYVWILETATGGFYLKNAKLTSNQYVNNTSSGNISFGNKNSIWSIAFTDGKALISNTSNSDRFIGETSSGSNEYKTYASSNLSSYGHDFTVYILEEEAAAAVATPAFSLAAGTYASAKSVTLSCTTDGATIYYTTNGTNPTNASSEYTGAISVTSTTTIKAIAIKESDESSVASATYTIVSIGHEGTEADPYTVADARNSIDATDGNKTDVYATGKVSEIVTAYSSQFKNITFKISTDGETTSDQLQAYRCKKGDGVSDPDVADIQVGDVVVIKGNLTKHNTSYQFAENNVLISLAHTVTPTCATPTFSLAEGTYYSAQNVTISCGTYGATIYYTTDGNEPTTSSDVYSDEIPVSATTTIKAIAVKDSYNNSAVASATYTIGTPISGLSIDFEDPVDAYADWEFSNIGIRSGIDGVTAHGGSKWGANVNSGGNGVATAYIKTKNKIANPSTFTCYVSKETDNATASTWTVQYSSNGDDWTDADTQDAVAMEKGVWNKFTAILSGNHNVFVRLSYSSTGTARRAIDDIILTLEPAAGDDDGAGHLTITTSDNMNGWRAFYDVSQDYEVDANTKIYVAEAKSATEGVVELTALSATAIPHGEAVILKTSAPSHAMVLTETTGVGTLGTNLLAVTDGTNNVDGYRLGYGEIGGVNAVGFFKYATTTAPSAGIVYIDKNNVNTSASARGLSISFTDDETTGVSELKAQKVEYQYFNLAGQRVAQPTKGLYIVNGKKVIVK